MGPGWVKRGAGEILLTSMDRDNKDGYDIALTQAVSNAVEALLLPQEVWEIRNTWQKELSMGVQVQC